MVEALGADDAEGDPACVEDRLDPRQQLQRPAAAGGGVDEEDERLLLTAGHGGEILDRVLARLHRTTLRGHEARDHEAARARGLRRDPFEAASVQSARQEPTGEAAAHVTLGGGQDQVAAGAQHAGELAAATGRASEQATRSKWSSG